MVKDYGQLVPEFAFLDFISHEYGEEFTEELCGPIIHNLLSVSLDGQIESQYTGDLVKLNYEPLAPAVRAFELKSDDIEGVGAH